MKNTEIKIERKGYRFNTDTRAPGSHCSLVLSLGRALPVTLSQLRKFDSLDVLNGDDADLIQRIYSKYGEVAEFQYTKSKTFVRLLNSWKLKELLKKDIESNSGILSAEFCNH